MHFVVFQIFFFFEQANAFSVFLRMHQIIDLAPPEVLS